MKFRPLLFLMFLSSLPAQNRSLDSLRAVLPSLHSKQRLEVLYTLSNQLEGIVPKDANRFGREGLDLALQLSDSASVATLLSSLAFSSSELGNFTDALTFGYRSLDVATAINDQKRIASAHSTLGITYVYLGQFSTALEHHLQALHIRETLGADIPIANTLNNIGIAYHNIGQYDKAISYYRQGLERIGPAAGSLIRARYLTNIGFAEFKRGDFPAATLCYTEAESLASEKQYSVIQAYLYFNLGMLYAETGQVPSALRYLERSLENYSQQEQKYGVVQVQNAIAAVLIRKKEFRSALRILDSAVAIAKRIDAPEQLKNSYEQYFRLYSITGPKDQEYRYFKLYSAAKDSSVANTESKRIAEVQFTHKIEEQQRTIAILTQERTIAGLNSDATHFRTVVLIAGIIVAAAVVGFLFVVNRRIARDNTVIASKNQELQNLNEALQQKIGEVNLLTGFLPVCSNCKKIKNDDGQWEQMELYISKRSEATFSHGICPDCMHDLYGDVLKRYRT